jgi:hypothetical protein
MTYGPLDYSALMAHVPSPCGTLMAYQTNKCAEFLQSTTRWAMLSPRLRKPEVDVARMVLPKTIAAPTSSITINT